MQISLLVQANFTPETLTSLHYGIQLSGFTPPPPCKFTIPASHFISNKSLYRCLFLLIPFFPFPNLYFFTKFCSPFPFSSDGSAGHISFPSTMEVDPYSFFLAGTDIICVYKYRFRCFFHSRNHDSRVRCSLNRVSLKTPKGLHSYTLSSKMAILEAGDKQGVF